MCTKHEWAIVSIFLSVFFIGTQKMDTSTQSKAKLGLEKQEHLVKLAILTTAAILCELQKH